jgi:hypothetical protein
MRHIALWSCTHIPNIIDLSGKTKKLWSGQASLRRSGRKNQTKTMSPFVRRGDIINVSDLNFLALLITLPQNMEWEIHVFIFYICLIFN